jgi:hypothetical protein
VGQGREMGMVGLILVALHPELVVKSRGAGTQKIKGVSIKTMLVIVADDSSLRQAIS